jgi:hypothetical protein
MIDVPGYLALSDRELAAALARDPLFVRLHIMRNLGVERAARVTRYMAEHGDIHADAEIVLWGPPGAALPPQADDRTLRPLSRGVRSLIGGAAESLPARDRERYATDWRTDALWLDGRWERLRYALFLRLWTVPRLRRQQAQADPERAAIPRRP